jgi:cobalt/nickel transport system ATP-binding protein
MSNSSFLNAGGKKCITIVTVLFMFLDEPTAGLDPHTRRTLIKLLHELPIATHDMRLVQDLFPRTIAMDEGQIKILC